jgi:hypothetical protein
VAKTLDPTHLDSSPQPPESVSILVVDDYAPWRSAPVVFSTDNQDCTSSPKRQTD